MMTRLYRGPAAAALIEDENFRQAWVALSAACPWGTCFQEPSYVSTWYRTYASRFEPLVASAVTPDGSLIGLLTLAVSQENGSLVAAGAQHAEYHVWLARPGESHAFIESALDLLAREFPGGRIQFLFIPPGTPVNWSQRWRDRCHWRSMPRPLMSTQPAEGVRWSLRKKSNKSRLNRLERQGKLRFERILDRSAHAAMLDEIIPLYDFRQGAVHDSLPFQDDPLAKPYYLAMLAQPHLLHVTVTRLAGRIVAAHIGIINRRQVLLGLITHAPDLSYTSIPL